MPIRIGTFALAAAAMAAAVFDLTGSLLAAIAAAAIPFALGATNIMPFAGWAVPVVFVAWAVTARTLAPPANAAAPSPDRAVLAAAPPAAD
ncbi:hypothetical protein GWK16_17210 [Roseomonas sp. JC162]|uniref:Uncharacterized protein n=1 Tax=Neoroseomonas marina TaxID=1232220 RepID=A0A848EHT0_9PROT|nr:hypothetical protein [Neoroseomonas marina]NMJ42990.1 hypothetical protein [Neoroseomonas marina]